MPKLGSGFTVEVGQKIGRGEVVDTDIRVTRGGYQRPGARLRCECGNFYEAPLSSLRPSRADGKPNTSSCGCARWKHLRQVVWRGGWAPSRQGHGMSNHELYSTWSLILQRCENPNFHKYPRYGGRGIELCDRWHDVRLFIEDIERELGPRPPGHTLNRIDNDGNYEIGNVEWANGRKQAANKERNGSSQYRGVQWVKAKQRWVTRVHLGEFQTEEEAAAMYQRAVAVLEREGILT